MRELPYDSDRVSLSFTILTFFSSLFVALTVVWLAEAGRFGRTEVAVVFIVLLAASGAWKYLLFGAVWIASFFWNFIRSLLLIITAISVQLAFVALRLLTRFSIPLIAVAALFVTGWRPPFWNNMMGYVVPMKSAFARGASEVVKDLSGIPAIGTIAHSTDQEPVMGEMEQATSTMARAWANMAGGERSMFEKLSGASVENNTWESVDFSRPPILTSYDPETGRMHFRIRRLDGSEQLIQWDASQHVAPVDKPVGE